MRFLRRLLLLAFVGIGVVAYNHWSQHGWSMPRVAASIEAEIAKQQATRLATKAKAKAGDVTHKVGDAVSDRALTAKIKSKMVLDDEVRARAINVDTSDAIVTLTGEVRSDDERDRAVRLAQETAGVTKVVDKLRVRES